MSARSLYVAVHGVAADSRIGTELTADLRDAGLTVIGVDSELDALVLVMSDAALADPAWMTVASACPAKRLVVVSVGMPTGDPPQRVGDINWVAWRPDARTAIFGRVLAGLLGDQGRRRLARQLGQQAEAWERAGRAGSLLTDDGSGGAWLRRALCGLDDDPVIEVDDTLRAFVEASADDSGISRLLLRAGRGVATVLILLTAWFTAHAVPQIGSRRVINRAAIVTAGNPIFLRDEPDWAAANAAELLIHGTKPQRELGRTTLLQMLGTPWVSSDLNSLEAVADVQPIDEGRHAAVIANAPTGSTFAVEELAAGRTAWWRHLDGALREVASDGRAALVAGTQLTLLDLRTRTVRWQRRQSLRHVQLGRRLALAWDDAMVVALTAATGEVVAKGQFTDVLAASEDRAGAVHVLSRDRDGLVRVYDLARGTAGRAGVRAPIDTVGGFDPTGRQALVVGRDGQLWTIAPGAAAPTGIPVPGRMHSVAWIDASRVALVSEERDVEVRFLYTGTVLGSVCAPATGLDRLAISPGGRFAACSGRVAGNSVWRLPPGPRATGAPRMSTSPTLAERGVRVETDDAELRISGGVVRRPTNWFNPIHTTLTASSLAPDGRHLAIGGQNGAVAVLQLSADGARILSVWTAPGAGVTAVGWQGEPVIATTDGRHWDVPSCSHCDTDDGMLDEARRQLAASCMTPTQLRAVSRPTRRRLGIRVCDEPHTADRS